MTLLGGSLWFQGGSLCLKESDPSGWVTLVSRKSDPFEWVTFCCQESGPSRWTTFSSWVGRFLFKKVTQLGGSLWFKEKVTHLSGSLFPCKESDPSRWDALVSRESASWWATFVRTCTATCMFGNWDECLKRLCKECTTNCFMIVAEATCGSFFWLLLAASGCFWLLLAPTGCSCLCLHLFDANEKPCEIVSQTCSCLPLVVLVVGCWLLFLGCWLLLLVKTQAGTWVSYT